MAEHPLTAEQEHAVDLFRTRQHLVIEARAGAGKTSTLVALANAAAIDDRYGTYHAFNKAIVEDSARRFPENVDARTIHSLAYQTVIRSERPDLGRRMKMKRLPRAKEARLLGIDAQQVDSLTGPRRLAAGFLAGYVLSGIDRWCQTGDPEPAAKHLPIIDVLDGEGVRGPNNRALAEAHVPAMRRAWAELIREGGQLRFQHQHYLKMFQLGGHKIDADFILFDEAQDTSGVMRSIILAQADYGTQLVFVGDSAQSIYGWMGATNAMDHLVGERARLSQSFRFGPAIAAVANRVLDGLPAEEKGGDFGVDGFDPIPSTVESIDGLPDCIITRTNARAVTEALALMASGHKVAVADRLRSTVVGFARAANDLMHNGWTSHPELAPFKSWGEVQDFVDTDVAGGDLALMVRLVDDFGPDQIIEGMEAAVGESAADVTITTAHTSKGREWDRVRLASDFPQRDPDTGMPPVLGHEERRLLYVAVTRAKLVLDIDRVDWIAPNAD